MREPTRDDVIAATEPPPGWERRYTEELSALSSLETRAGGAVWPVMEQEGAAESAAPMAMASTVARVEVDGVDLSVSGAAPRAA